jgi:DNA-binding IclR family transcriptional regulator
MPKPKKERDEQTDTLASLLDHGADGAPEGGQRAVQSVEVGGRLLLALAQQPGPLSLKDLAALAGLTPARAHPYLVSFGRLRLVEQQPSGRYALGPAALQMGLTALHQLDAMREAEAVAEALAATTGHAVAIAAWGNFGPTVVRMIEAQQPLLVSMRAGTVMSLLGTATGRAFAAVLPRERLLQATTGAVGDPPGRATRLSAEDLAIVEAARKDVRAHGAVRAKGRPIPGINAFSAPALDHEGQPALVITALDHEERCPVDWNSASARAVRDAAREVSSRLGWAGGATGLR